MLYRILVIFFFFIYFPSTSYAQNFTTTETNPTIKKQVSDAVNVFCDCVDEDSFEMSIFDDEKMQECFLNQSGLDSLEFVNMFVDSTLSDSENQAFLERDIIPLFMAELISQCPKLVPTLMQAMAESNIDNNNSFLDLIIDAEKEYEKGNYNVAIAKTRMNMLSIVSAIFSFYYFYIN